MAVRVPSFSKVRGPTGGIDAVVITWAGLLNGDTGQSVQRPDLADLSIQFEGTFGASGNGTIEGSNDSTDGTALTDAVPGPGAGHFHALNNPFGSTIGIGSGAIQERTEATRWIRPHVTAGDGTTNLTATVLARRSLRGG